MVSAIKITTGQRNLISDVDGILVGNAHCQDRVSGVTVVMLPNGNICAVDVRGGSPATRETDLLTTSGSVNAVDAIVLSGGSVYGLAAADGVIDYLQEIGSGFRVKDQVYPIVPAASLFDFFGPGDKKSVSTGLYHDLGRQAAQSASADYEIGSTGAGYGVRAQKLKSGLGSASVTRSDGVSVGVVLAANPTGSVVIPGTDVFWAWPFEQNGELGGQKPPQNFNVPPTTIEPPSGARTNTVIGVVATNVALGQPELFRIATMAHDGLSRAINPVHMPEDGDLLFAVSTNRKQIEMDVRELGLIGALAADCVARAVARAVYSATSVGYLKSYTEKYKEK